LDWQAPFAVGEKKWTYKQVSVFQPEKLAPLLRQAALRDRNAAYETAVSKITSRTRINAGSCSTQKRRRKVGAGLKPAPTATARFA
jgi:hypothetical protein